MAEQVFVNSEVVRRAKGGTLTLSLQIFAENANPETDEPLFADTASADVKASVDDLTVQELIDKATREAGKELRDKVRAWRRVQEYNDLVNTEAVVTAIANELAG